MVLVLGLFASKVGLNLLGFSGRGVVSCSSKVEFIRNKNGALTQEADASIFGEQEQSPYTWERYITDYGFSVILPFPSH